MCYNNLQAEFRFFGGFCVGGGKQCRVSYKRSVDWCCCKCTYIQEFAFSREWCVRRLDHIWLLHLLVCTSHYLAGLYALSCNTLASQILFAGSPFWLLVRNTAADTTLVQGYTCIVGGEKKEPNNTMCYIMMHKPPRNPRLCFSVKQIFQMCL